MMLIYLENPLGQSGLNILLLDDERLSGFENIIEVIICHRCIGDPDIPGHRYNLAAMINTMIDHMLNVFISREIALEPGTLDLDGS